jgi:hypothetical protein
MDGRGRSPSTLLAIGTTLDGSECEASVRPSATAPAKADRESSTLPGDRGVSLRGNPVPSAGRRCTMRPARSSGGTASAGSGPRRTMVAAEMERRRDVNVSCVLARRWGGGRSGVSRCGLHNEGENARTTAGSGEAPGSSPSTGLPETVGSAVPARSATRGGCRPAPSSSAADARRGCPDLAPAAMAAGRNGRAPPRTRWAGSSRRKCWARRDRRASADLRSTRNDSCPWRRCVSPSHGSDLCLPMGERRGECGPNGVNPSVETWGRRLAPAVRHGSSLRGEPSVPGGTENHRRRPVRSRRNREAIPPRPGRWRINDSRRAIRKAMARIQNAGIAGRSRPGRVFRDRCVRAGMRRGSIGSTHRLKGFGTVSRGDRVSISSRIPCGRTRVPPPPHRWRKPQIGGHST